MASCHGFPVSRCSSSAIRSSLSNSQSRRRPSHSPRPSVRGPPRPAGCAAAERRRRAPPRRPDRATRRPRSHPRATSPRSSELAAVRSPAERPHRSSPRPQPSLRVARAHQLSEVPTPRSATQTRRGSAASAPLLASAEFAGRSATRSTLYRAPLRRGGQPAPRSHCSSSRKAGAQRHSAAFHAKRRSAPEVASLVTAIDGAELTRAADQSERRPTVAAEAASGAVT